MDEYLKIVESVIRNSESSYFATGKDVNNKRHPEDLMVALQSTAETVALTLVALDQIGLVDKKPVKKK
jgi:hypothetical protein